MIWDVIQNYENELQLIPKGETVPEGWVVVAETANPDYLNQTYVVSTSVTMRQARLALLSVGLLDDVDNALAAIPDPIQRKAAQIEWEYATEVQRYAGLVATLGPALGMSESQVDQLFILASTL